MAQGFSNPPGQQLWHEPISLRSTGVHGSTREIGLLVASGVLGAAAMAMIHLNLRVPGHAILKPMLPITLGLAFAARQVGGCIAGLAAAATAVVLLVGHIGEIHASSLTSLVLLGPALDLAARGVHTRAAIVARSAAAGLAVNMLAIGVKLVAAPLGWESGGGRGFAALWPYPILTFAGCGILAGVLSALVCLAAFRRDHAGDGP